MKSIIYWFSGTGHSLEAAREIGRELGDEVRKISTSPEGADLREYGRIGFVFPVYAWGMPELVERFIGSSRFGKDSYIWAAAMSGGNQGPALKGCARAVRKSGGRLRAGFALKRPLTEEDGESTGLIKIMQNVSRARPGLLKDRKEEIVRIIGEGAFRRPEGVRPLGNFFGSILHAPAVKAFLSQDKAFFQTESCNGCGVCVQICPVGNLSLNDGKLNWAGRCQQCYACLAGCSAGGIGSRIDGFAGLKLNPAVTRKDLLA